MPDQATERTRIDSPPADVFAVALDIERYPEWARDVKEARTKRVTDMIETGEWQM